MNTMLLVSTALVTPQRSGQTGPDIAAPKAPAGGRAGQVAAIPAPGQETKPADAGPTAATGTRQSAVVQQSAPNSALTTYRDQDSGRLIVRVYDRESGDVLVEFPPEKAFRPAGSPLTGPPGKAKTSFSV